MDETTKRTALNALIRDRVTKNQESIGRTVRVVKGLAEDYPELAPHSEELAEIHAKLGSISISLRRVFSTSVEIFRYECGCEAKGDAHIPALCPIHQTVLKEVLEGEEDK